jgi:hypothetical protein
VKKYDRATARVTVDDKGDWILTVTGTDIYRKLWNEDEVVRFPGASMCHRLIEEGWTPDRRAGYVSSRHSPVQRMLLSQQAGWQPSGKNSWTIPCWRERQ